jgi:tape measure domain-containing protein
MADAAQRLAALNQALAQTRTQSATTQQSTQQVAQAFQALNQSIQQQTQAYTQAQGATQQYRQAQLQLLEAIRQQRQEQQQATQATQAQGSALRTAFSIAGGIGLATSLGAIVGQMKELAVSTIQVGAQFQQLRTSLAAVAGGAQQGGQSFQFLIETANRYGFSLQSVAGSYRGLAAATRGTNLEGEQTRRIFESVTAAGRTVGATSQEMGRILTALQQMVSKGVVSMEELRQQLGEGLPGAFQIAARAMGVTTERFSQMVASGQVLTTDFLPKFARQLREELGQGAQQGAATAQAAFARLENEWNLLKERIARGGPLRFLTQVVSSLSGDLEAARLAAEAAQARVGRQAEQARFPLTPGGRQRPGTVTGATEEELARLQAINAEYDTLQKRIAENRAAPMQGIPGLQQVQEALRQRLEQQATALEREQRALQQTIAARRFGQQGVGARTSGVAEDPTEQERERLKGIEEGRKRVNDRLDETKQKLKEVNDLNRIAPERLGDTQNKADQQVAILNSRLKEQQEGLKKAAEEALKLGTAIDETTQKNLDKARSDVRATEGQIKAIQDQETAREKAERKAAQDAAAAERRAAQQVEQAKQQVLTLDAFQERLGAFMRRPEEGRAEEAASRIRVQGAAIQRELETQILALEKSPAFQAGRPGALDALRSQREALTQSINVQAEEAYTAALTKQMGTLDELARKYGFVTQEANDLARAEKEAEQFQGTPLQEQAKERLQVVRDVATVEAQIVDLKRQAAASERAGLEAMKEARASTAFDATLTEQLERLRAPREERTELRLRAQARKQSLDLTPDQDAQLRAITEQERLNEALELTRRLGEGVSQSLADGLLSIADGTKNVSEAFEQMAKNIIENLAKIAISEGFQALLKIGLKALGGALSGGSGFSDAGASAGGGAAGFEILMAQSGAVVNRPTLMMVGEGAYNPEVILNRPQLNSLVQSAMQAGPSAGGQAAGGAHVTVINVADRAEGERRAAQERSLGRQVVINYVMDELAQGSGSRIGQVLRNGQR